MSDVSKGFSLGCGFFIALVGIPCLVCGGCLIVGMARVQDAGEKAAKAQSAVERSPAKQQQREAFIRKMIDRGIFTRTEDRGGGLVRAWTGPVFDGLDVQAKEDFAGVVYAYYFDGSSPSASVILHDGRTGKKIGSMTRYGLSMR
jgi:hypothetical protein